MMDGFSLALFGALITLNVFELTVLFKNTREISEVKGSLKSADSEDEDGEK